MLFVGTVMIRLSMPLVRARESDMVADPLTKYLSYAVWNRHMHYLLNANPPGYKSEGKVQWN